MDDVLTRELDTILEDYTATVERLNRERQAILTDARRLLEECEISHMQQRVADKLTQL